MPKRKTKASKTIPVETDFFSLELSRPVFDLYQQVNQRRIDTTARPVPSRLYHYTNAGGLLGIIEQNKLWATHVNYLNDASELRYARSLVEAALSGYEQTGNSAHASEFVRRARDMFDVSKTMDVFVSCFCEEGDLLSQWRGYAQAGEGYSIGVDGDLLGQIGGGLNFFFGNVVYDRKVQEETIQYILNRSVRGVNELTAGLPDGKASSLVDEVCHIFRRALWYPLVTFKDAMFAEENEWRAIEIMNRSETEKRVRFRSRASKLVPYIEVDFSNLQPVPPYQQHGKIPIREVFHGPTLNPDLSVRALQLLLAKHGYADAEVKGSRIPLRL
jgi:hypothetical protein